VRLKLTIAYDGTNYEGWQVQKIGVGVQQKIEEAIAKIFQAQIRLHGSSRTDTGVHARAMIAHFDLPEDRLRMNLSKVALALNAQLPEDIRIMEAHRAPESFHARFSATGKQYRYSVVNHPSMYPLLRQQAWHVPAKLDLAAMRKAVKHFVGKQDFAAFANNRNYAMESTVRTIFRCELRKSGPLLTFVIEGDGFLYKMCRGIVGTVIQVGMGKFQESDIRRMLAAKDRRMVGMTAPAHGLTLWKVFYES
jgi:tRNA pseudouridine38-40 synthase